MDKRALINRMCERVTGGRAVATAYLGMSESKFNNHLYENKGARFFSVDELVALQTLSESTWVAEYFAARSNAIVVPAPSAEVDTVELHHMSLNTAVKRSAVDQLILDAIREHGEINEQAQQKILDAHRKHIATRDGEVRATLQVYGK
ncbi:YmfL family putative regulatory protein [Candidatus Fukatsuia endosymbiont of Tuberolachnus salignus]|uniref:YmfL family putative regulatory protein n=1 Tax=Candidatus Fukatsuia endosymbiont of Tuberolachnus salignus TaxID=3077957 RepID=UPI00313DCDB7